MHPLSFVVALAAGSSLVAQVSLTHLGTIDVASTSNAGNPEYIGSNPSAVAWNGTDVWVGGFNSSGATGDAAIVKVSNALTAPSYGARFGVQPATVNQRGYSGLDVSGGLLAAAYDNGSATPDGITGWDLAGNQLWGKSARGSSGVGIDPGCRPERIESAAASRLEWIQDFYGEAYGELHADLVFCRHTLEHIQPVQKFMQTVRRAIGGRLKTAVAFELPDMERVLTDLAFWDIYYEHCSYFTAGSLRRLFQRAGFEVVAEDKVYDGQYLLIDAYPGAAASTPTGAAGSDDVRETASQVARFEEVVSAELAKWRAYFEDAAARGEQVVLWGSGSKAVAFLTTLGLGDEVACVTDINPFRHGMFMPGSGHRIVPPEDLALLRPQRVVAMNAIYQQEIAQQLRELGVDAALVAV